MGSFYTASALWRPLSTVMLVNEMFRQQKRQIKCTVGEIIPYAAYRNLSFDTEKKVRLFRSICTALSAKASYLCSGRKARLLCLNAVELLGSTPDGKLIFLCARQESSPLLREMELVGAYRFADAA